MKINLRSCSSFTFIEVVFSILLIVIICLAAIDVLVVAKYSTSYAKHKIQATYYAQQEIERLRKFDYATMQTQAGTFNDVRLDTRGTPSNLSDDFMATRVITIGSDGGNFYRTVTVQIQWNETFFGRTRQMSEYCATYIANEPQVN